MQPCINQRQKIILTIYRYVGDVSIGDLRYKMGNLMGALNSCEKNRILYHGKVKGEIIPLKGKSNAKTINHPIYGMLKEKKEKPEYIVSKMRRNRNGDL